MDELVAVLHDTTASGLELDFIAGVHRFDMVVEKLLENHEIPYFSMCSGTGLDSRCHDALASFWSAQYGTKFRWRELGVCEHSEKKQRWLRSQHAHIEVLVSELEEMAENVVKNIKDEKRAVYQAFPYCWDGGAGWPCTSLTSLNCHASTNVGSVQAESSESGRAFAMVHKAVETHGPEIFCMENVMNVWKDTPSGISDADWVERQMAKEASDASAPACEAGDASASAGQAGVASTSASKACSVSVSAGEAGSGSVSDREAGGASASAGAAPLELPLRVPTLAPGHQWPEMPPPSLEVPPVKKFPAELAGKGGSASTGEANVSAKMHPRRAPSAARSSSRARTRAAPGAT